MAKHKNGAVDPNNLKKGINKLVKKLPSSLLKSTESPQNKKSALKKNIVEKGDKESGSPLKNGLTNTSNSVDKKKHSTSDGDRIKLKFRNFTGNVHDFKNLLDSNVKELGLYKSVNYRPNKIVVSFSNKDTLDRYLSFYNKYTHNDQRLKVSELDYFETVKSDYKHLYLSGIPEEYDVESVEKGLKRRISIEFKISKHEDSFKLSFKNVSDCVKANSILNNSSVPLVKNKKEKLVKVTTSMESFGTSSKNSSRVFVRNLPFKTTYDELLTFFKNYDKGAKVHMPSKSKGYAFVNFSSLEKSKSVISELNGTLYKKRRIQLSLSLPKQLYDPKKSKTPEKDDDEEPEEEVEEMDLDDSEFEAESEEPSNLNKSNQDKSQEKLANKDTLEDTIFVRNLDYNCTENELLEYFCKFGEVDSCNICLNEDKSSKGTAFVRFKNKHDVNKILENEKLSLMRDEELNSQKPILGVGYTLRGRRLKIDRALDKDRARMLKKQKDEQSLKDYNDKKNMHLLFVGVVTEDSPIFNTLTEDQKESVKQYLEKKLEKIKQKNTFVNPKRICVKNIPGNINSNDLRTVINEHLKSVMDPDEYHKLKQLKNRGVLDVRLLKGDSYTKDEQGVKVKKKKPYAFIEFLDHDIAMKIQQFFSNNSTLYNQKTLQCEFTVDTSFGEKTKVKDNKLKVKKKKYSRGKRQREKRRALKLKSQ